MKQLSQEMLADIVKRQRIAKNLTQEQLSDLPGIN